MSATKQTEEEVSDIQMIPGTSLPPSLPPLSNSSLSIRHRVSKSPSYNKASPEWYWKITPNLPEIWIRDGRLLTARVISELEAAWRLYNKLNIPGKGDGATYVAKTRTGRRELEKLYQKLDPETRRAKEVALARYDPFAIRGQDGSLDYHTELAPRSENGNCNSM